jgi:hypothetical protein
MTAGGPALDPWHDPRLGALESEVATTEAALVDAQVELETLRVEIANFAQLHHHRLGPMYERLDELDALIAEAVAARTGAAEDIKRAYEARGVVQDLPDLDELFARLTAASETAETAAAAEKDDAASGRAAGVPPPTTPERVSPSKQAQRLYRDLARRAHPDLTQDEQEKARRSAFITRVNAAYAQGDLDLLARLGAEWAAGADAAPAGQGPDRLAWLRTRLDWLRAALEAVAAQRAELTSSAIGQLMSLAPEDPDALLVDLADRLSLSIAERESRLSELVADVG